MWCLLRRMCTLAQDCLPRSVYRTLSLRMGCTERLPFVWSMVYSVAYSRGLRAWLRAQASLPLAFWLKIH